MGQVKICPVKIEGFDRDFDCWFLAVAGGRVRAPPSEQSEPEPRKYMGGNIPSRSFRMLQAMTALDPEGESLGFDVLRWA